MPLFRRKSTGLVEDANASDDAARTDAVEVVKTSSKAYTAPKGRETPKRAPAQRRRPTATQPLDRRETARQRRERLRAQRAEALEGMRRGDERYLPPRDRGPERALVRDIVDSRRTAGTWFFGGAIPVIIGSSTAMPYQVQVASNILWITLVLVVIIDSILIARRIKRLVRERFPKTDQRIGSLCLYGIMRGLTFRRMRIPNPRVKIGDKI